MTTLTLHTLNIFQDNCIQYFFHLTFVWKITDYTKKVPLVLALHWTDEGKEHVPYLNCLARPGLEKLNGIIFAPYAGEWYFWDENNYSLIIT